MPKQFRDDDGKVYEGFYEYPTTDGKTAIAIKPIEPAEPEEKRLVLQTCFLDFRNGKLEFFNETYDFTEAGARAVSKCLKAVLEYINTTAGDYRNKEVTYLDLVDNARKEVQGGR